MALRDLINKLKGDQPAEYSGFACRPDDEGANFVLPAESFRQCAKGQGNELQLLQYTHLKMLVEQGLADELPNGFVVSADDTVHFDEDFRCLLNLPDPWPGSFSLEPRGQTTRPGFQLDLQLELQPGDKIAYYELNGPILELSDSESYLPTPAQWRVLRAVQEHQALDATQRDEYRNLKTIVELKKAQDEGALLSLAHFEQFDPVVPEHVSINICKQDDGGALITPTYGPGIDVEEVERRLGQIDPEGHTQSLRVGNKIILLDEKKLKATHEVLRNRRVKKEDLQLFLETPSAFLDAEMVDLDIGFSFRVRGITKFKHAYFGDTDATDIDWFEQLSAVVEKELKKLNHIIHSQEDLERFKEKLENALATGADILDFNGETISLEDLKSLENDLKKLEEKFTEEEGQDEPFIDEVVDLEEEEEGDEPSVVDIALHDDELDSAVVPPLVESEYFYKNALNFSDYLRTPYPHQNDGIRWILGLALEAHKDEPPEGQTPVSGGLLADDMGLGKTYMSLAAIREYYRILEQRGETCRPVLVVAPLSLLDVWMDEVSVTFKESPFRDIVVLQSNADLSRYKFSGAGVETQQKAIDPDDEEGGEDARVRYSLKIGSRFGPERLDLDRRLVLTTYQALRDYQFSLCSIDWSFVVFDEAQNIKNPNTLQTRAAKGLKSNFNLLVTGTPVENHLGDFWCLFDTACPGLLGAYQDFRKHYVLPITRAPKESQNQTRSDVGKKLRTNVGGLMLRRLKEDNLEGLPRKTIFVGVEHANESERHLPDIKCMMRNEQLDTYNAVCATTNRLMKEQGNRRPFLQGLLQLRDVSLHPGLWCSNGLPVPRTETEAQQIMRQSDKLTAVLDIMNEIKGRGEKVIVFAITKKLQMFLKLALERIYEIPVEIINGDTKTIAKRNTEGTRKNIIARFENTDGFSVLIMSPVAAGVGLTVTAANNVIHLERHWNPAKEAQATDRVYRIGQTKDVNVYVPVLHHPQIKSFEVNLNHLLSQKLDLKDAVVTPSEVKAHDFGEDFFGGETRDEDTTSTRVLIEHVKDLEWEAFEALSAVICEKEFGGEAYLTPKNDYGCDVVVINSQEGNMLVQCKHKFGAILSEYTPFTEIVGSKPHYEKKMNRIFSKLFVFSNAQRIGPRAKKAQRDSGVEAKLYEFFKVCLSKYAITKQDLFMMRMKKRVSF